MRPDDKARKIIKSEFATQLGEEAVVRLFGSRVDDTQYLESAGDPLDTLQLTLQGVHILTATQVRMADYARRIG